MTAPATGEAHDDESARMPTRVSPAQREEEWQRAAVDRAADVAIEAEDALQRGDVRAARRQLQRLRDEVDDRELADWAVERLAATRSSTLAWALWLAVGVLIALVAAAASGTRPA